MIAGGPLLAPFDVCGLVLEQADSWKAAKTSRGEREILGFVSLLRSIGLRRVTVSPSGTRSAKVSAALTHSGKDGVLSPIDGIVAAMSVSPGRHLLVLGTDHAAVDGSLLLTLIRRSGRTSGAALRVHGRSWDATCAVYPPNSLDVAIGESQAGGSPSSLLSRLRSAGRVTALDLAPAYERRLNVGPPAGQERRTAGSFLSTE